ncbi:MAG TPA: MoaD/ThiS family protein [Atribacterota bacterium]|nr:MoaD/ThiS family protein [Atribacterota bacterium]
MKVKLIVYSNLKNYIDGYQDSEGLLKEISKQMTIKDFLQENIKHKRAMDGISMVIVNEKVIPFHEIERNLQDGDVIKIYPPMGGG